SANSCPKSETVVKLVTRNRKEKDNRRSPNLNQRAHADALNIDMALTTPPEGVRQIWLLQKLNAPSTPRNCAAGLKLPTYQLTTLQNPHGAIVAVQRTDEPPLPASLFSTNEIFPTDVSWNFPWLAARPSRKSNSSPLVDTIQSPSIFRIALP